MDIVFFASMLIILVFSFVIAFGAPFLPTLRARTDEAIDLLGLKTGQTLLELGSGDGRILRAAAAQGIKGIGYELNPLLVWYSRLACFKYRKLVTIKCRNYWQVRLPECNGIYVFLLNPYMAKLNKKIMKESKSPIRLVSFAFKIPGRTPVKEKNGLMLYEYNQKT